MQSKLQPILDDPTLEYNLLRFNTVLNTGDWNNDRTNDDRYSTIGRATCRIR